MTRRAENEDDIQTTQYLFTIFIELATIIRLNFKGRYVGLHSGINTLEC